MIPLALALLAGDVAEVMERVARSQEDAQQARSQFVYRQEVRAKLIRSDGKPAREERYVFEITPAPNGQSKKLTEFQGFWYDKGQKVGYSEPGFERKEMDIDAELIKDLLQVTRMPATASTATCFR